MLRPCIAGDQRIEISAAAAHAATEDHHLRKGIIVVVVERCRSQSPPPPSSDPLRAGQARPVDLERRGEDPGLERHLRADEKGPEAGQRGRGAGEEEICIGKRSS